MKTMLFTLLLSMRLAQVVGQSFSYPTLSKSVIAAKSIVPANWKIKSIADGDLNGDGMADVAIVIEYNKTVKEHRPNGVVNDGHPRILLILFKTDRGYQPALQNNTIILRDGEGGMVRDAFDKIFIAKRVLNINYEFVRDHSYYKYRYQQGDFYLIGATLTANDGHKIEDHDYNFSTRKAVFKFDTIDGDQSKTEHKTIKAGRLNSLHEASIPYEWKVE